MRSVPNYKITEPDVVDHDHTWVTKSQFTLFLRCPYYFWLVDSGQLPDVVATIPQLAERIEHGIRVHEQITETAKPLVINPDELENVLRNQSITLLDLPVFSNDNLRIRGIPDGIVTGNGALYPLEIKSRKEPKRDDKLELTFYWLLLNQLRTKNVQPLGHLWLREINGKNRDIEIKITEKLIEEVLRLLDELRRIRKEGTKPRYHNCPYCSGEIREVSLQASHEQRDISLIRGVGPVTLRLLEQVGIKSYVQLEQIDKFVLLQNIRASGGKASLDQILKWKQHAKSYISNQPVIFGQLPKIDHSFIALDLEYMPQTHIWMIGIALVKRSKISEISTLWADDNASEKANLQTLINIILKNNRLKVVTWNGKVADIPQLSSASFRYPGIMRGLNAIKERHLDLFEHVSQNVRMPIPELGLHSIAKYYQLPQSSQVADGLQASFMFQQYQQHTDDSEKKVIKEKLLEYSRLDMEALVGVIDRIKSLSRSQQR